MRWISLAAAVTFGLLNHVAAADPNQDIRHALQSLQPDLPIESVSESALSGIYQVQLGNGQLLYASADGKYLLQGSLFQVQNGKAVNLTDGAQRSGVVRRLDSIPRQRMVVFPAKEPKAHITVFTDTTCPYCQKLHSEVAELNAKGVEVRYLAYPREGVSSAGYQKLVSVWCAKDKLAAMNAASTGKKVAEAQCDNPVAEQYRLGMGLGVQGTPSIFLADGRMLAGYLPADELAKEALAASQKGQND